MDLDDIHEVTDYTEISLRRLVERLRASRSVEQLIYRETELDELWRVVDIACAHQGLPPGEAARLAEFRRGIMRAHDLVGVDMQPQAAAAELERAARQLG
jgi:hypothetical protein